jgi:hypothetical protein
MRTALSSILVALALVPGGARGEEAAPAPPAEIGEPAADARAEAWSLSAGTGGGSFVEWVDALAGAGVSGYDASRMRDRLQLNLRADREQGRRFRAGVAYVYNGWTDALASAGASVGTVENRVHTVLVDCTLRWISTDRVELYSALAAGYAWWAQRGTGVASSLDRVTSGFAFQLRYVGVALGNERLRAFVDLGIGFEGLVVGGLTARF